MKDLDWMGTDMWRIIGKESRLPIPVHEGSIKRGLALHNVPEKRTFFVIVELSAGSLFLLSFLRLQQLPFAIKSHNNMCV